MEDMMIDGRFDVVDSSAAETQATWYDGHAAMPPSETGRAARRVAMEFFC